MVRMDSGSYEAGSESNFSSFFCHFSTAEYEDTFPFEGELSLLAATHAYSKDDIAAILTIAEECSLTVIPLVGSTALWFKTR